MMMKSTHLAGLTRKVVKMSQQRQECIQIERITRIETNLENMQKMQSVLIKLVTGVISGVLIEFFSILFVYLIKKG